jgi:hypothetical protein
MFSILFDKFDNQLVEEALLQWLSHLYDMIVRLTADYSLYNDKHKLNDMER